MKAKKQSSACPSAATDTEASVPKLGAEKCWSKLESRLVVSLGVFSRRKTLKVINQELVKRTIALLFLPKNRMTKPNPSVAGMSNHPATTPVCGCKNVVLP